MFRRRKHFRSARSGFRSYKRARHHRKSGFGGGLGGDLGLIGGAALYGAGRGYVSDKLSPILSKIPAGEYADEVGLGLLGYFMMKGKIPLINKVPMSRDIGKAMVVIEAARIGSGLASGMTTTTATQTSMIY